jgi:3-dehydroquinate dehydratase-1
MINKGNLKDRPLVIAPVTTLDDLVFLDREGPSDACDLFEYRLDNLRDHLDLAESVADKLEGRLLITARHPEEGGEFDLDESARLQLMTRFLPKATLIDSELRSLQESSALLALSREARAAEVGVVASMHDFDKMLPLIDLQAAAARAAEIGVDVVKVAVVVEKMGDIFDLAELIENTEIPVSAMGMGPLGKLSRLVLARAGSVLNYGYLKEPNAPGQWPVGELKRLINEIF